MSRNSVVCEGCTQTCPEVDSFKCKYIERMRYYFENSNLDRPYWNFDKPTLLATKDREVFKRLAHIEKNIAQFVDNGQNLLIHSQICGNGKSTWARRLLQEYFRQSLFLKYCIEDAGCMLSMTEFFDRQRDNISEEDLEFQPLKKRLLNADLVVWDDIAVAPLSEFGATTFMNIIDTRINRRLSNIYTTNLSPDGEEFQKFLGYRTWSRITKLSEHIEFLGEERRSINGFYGNATNLV